MILARHAEAVYWAGRQLERAESTTRALDIIGRNAMHLQAERAAGQWRAVLDLFGAFDAEKDDVVDSALVMHRLFGDRSYPGSVVASVGQLRENVRTVRDRVPVELWEEANRLDLTLRADPIGVRVEQTPFEVFSEVRRGCQTMAGVAAESMPRDETYTFFDIGRMLERSIGTCRVARTGLTAHQVGIDAAIVLRVNSSLQAFRRRRAYADDPRQVAGFLLRAEHVPRTVLACLRRIDDRLHVLGGQGAGVAAARQLCGRVRSELEFGDVAGRLEDDAWEFLGEVEGGLVTIGTAIATYAFNPAHSPVLQSQFVRPGSEGR